MADPGLPRSAAGPNSPWLIAVIVSIATFMEVLDTTIANVALRHIAGGLAASQDESTWIVTSYLVSNAIVLPISGWLSNVLGRKNFYMGCVAIFTLSSLMCSFANSLSFMIVCRVLQGIGGGGLAPTEQSIFADSFPPAKRAQAFALYGLTVVVAPAVGPVLGGWLTDTLSWHWVFLINVPVGLLSLTLTGLFVYEPEILKQERRQRLAHGFSVDYAGFALVVLGFGALQVLLDRFVQDDGFASGSIVALTIIAVGGLVSLVVWEWLHPQPVFAVRLLAVPDFAVANVIMFVIGFMLISTSQLLPQMAQTLLGYNAITAGMTLGMGGLATIILMPVVGIVTGRFVQPKWLLIGALVITGLAMLHMSTLDTDISFWNLSWARVYQAMALPFLFIPLSAASYAGVPPNRTNEASAMTNLTRNIGGSVGVSLATAMLQWRGQFHHARLAESVTPYTSMGGRTLAQMQQVVQTQASMMSYLDIFWILGLIALFVSPIALILRSPRPGAALAH